MLSPEERESLRQRLERLRLDGDPLSDIAISGSPEHLSALRRVYEAYHCRQVELQAKYREVYDEIMHVNAELGVGETAWERSKIV